MDWLNPPAGRLTQRPAVDALIHACPARLRSGGQDLRVGACSRLAFATGALIVADRCNALR